MFLTQWLNIPHMSNLPDDLSLCLPLLPSLSPPSTPFHPHCCWPDLPPSLSMVSLTSSLSSQPRSPVHPHLSLIPTRSVYSRRSSTSWRKRKATLAEILNVQTRLVQLPSHGCCSNPVTNGFLLKTFSRGASQTARQKGSQSVSQENYTASEPERQPVSKQILINRSVPLLLANQTLSLSGRECVWEGGVAGMGGGWLRIYVEARARMHTWVHTPLTLASVAL